MVSPSFQLVACVNESLDAMVDHVRAPTKLCDCIVAYDLAEMTARLEGDASYTTCRRNASAGTHWDGITGIVDVSYMLSGRLWSCIFFPFS